MLLVIKIIISFTSDEKYSKKFIRKIKMLKIEKVGVSL